jgi:hypothetical protein
MIVTRYRTDVPTLVAALTDVDHLARYQNALGEELRISAERALADHIKRMSALAGMALAQGFESMARQDTAAADALLTDLFAVATWHGWELPVTPLGETEFDPTGLTRGLLGADGDGAGAALWQVDGATLAFARCRVAIPEARMDDHPRR